MNSSTLDRMLPKLLQGSAKYKFPDTTVVLCFWDANFDWSLVSIAGVYDFGNIQIGELEFEELTDNDYVYNITPSDGAKAKLFKLNIRKIDRHILMKQFTFTINYMFYEDIDMRLFSSKYTIDVSCKYS